MMAAIMRLFIYYLICLLFSASSGSLRQASCGSTIPPINALFIYYFLIYYSVSAAAACVKHPAGHANVICLFVYLLSMYYLVPAAAACVRHPAAVSCRPLSFIYLRSIIYHY